jgi:prepilin-type N-terminal cleavage/methylation domain-containing protein
MLARIRKTQEENEGGFTLIELLVVIIIIGILAAIAIPTFLNQRVKGWESAAKSELKNAATAQESYFTDNSTYVAASAAGEASLVAEGYNASANVDLEIATTGTSYIMCAVHASGGKKYVFRSTGTGAGTPVALAASNTACPTT